MEIGISLPTVGPISFREFILATALEAERAGLHSVWVQDHVALPKDRSGSTYPFPRSEDGLDFIYDAGMEWLDPIAVMGLVAGATERIKLGTSVLVLPYRNPLVLANEVGTLDKLSEGRVLLGIGSGWLKEEFAAIGVPFENRGRRTDEYVRAMRQLWTKDEPSSFEGRFVAFSDVQLASRPSTPGGPPILIGGNSPAATRRVAEIGDGWLAFDVTPEEARAGAARIRELATAAGRDPDAITISARAGVVPAGGSDFTPNRPAIRGSHDEILERLRGFADAGVQVMVLDLIAPLDEVSAAVRWLGAEAAPALL